VSAIPSGATHKYRIMFLGLVYIKYVDGFPYYFDESKQIWSKCNCYFQADPI